MAPMSWGAAENNRGRDGAEGEICVLSELEIAQSIISLTHTPPSFMHRSISLCCSSTPKRHSLLKTFTFLPGEDSYDLEFQSTQVFTGRLKEDPDHSGTNQPVLPKVT